MKMEIGVDEHKGIGPLKDMYGHGPVTVIVPEGEDAAELFCCLDCGYMAHEDRLLAHEACNREDNNINQTWREWFEAEDASELPHPDEDEDWPIE